MGSSVRETVGSQQEAIDRIVQVASRPEERRGTDRFPFFSPVKIVRSESALPAGGDQAGDLLVFAREISRSGIGLFHTAPLARGEMTIAVNVELGQKVELRIELLWCTAQGDGCYISGGRFICSGNESLAR